MGKTLKVIFISIAALLFAVLGLYRMPSLVAILALSIGTVYFVSLKIKNRSIKNVIATLFLLTFFLQLVIGLSFYNQTVDTKYYGFSYKGDDHTYGDFGITVGDLWRRGVFLSLTDLAHYSIISRVSKLDKFQLYNAFIFYIFGAYGAQILLILNCFLHSAIIIPVYFILKDLNIKNEVIIFSFILFLSWPSTFYWSLFNFKEAIILFIIFIIFNLLLLLRQRMRGINLLFLLLAIIALWFIREYLAILLSVTLAYIFYLWKWERKNVFLLCVLILLLLRQLTGKPMFSNLFETYEALPQLVFGIRRGSFSLAQTPYFENLYTPTYLTNFIYLPSGIMATMFLPFLLKPFTVMQIAANIESIIWWCFMPFLISGLSIAIRKEMKKTFMIIFVFFYWLIILALTQGNMGTLIRQKSLLYYTGFIFITLSIDRLLDRVTRHPKGAAKRNQSLR